MSGEPRQILVIDDDDVVRQSIVAYLEDSDFLVKEANSGTLGIERLKNSSPDLIVTDLRMANVDGLDVLKAVQKWKPEIPVIVVSGMGVVRDVVDSLRLGASDYLVKPLVDMEVLVHAVHRCLERSYLKRENLGYREQLEKANRELRAAVRELERDQIAGRRIQNKFLPKKPLSHNGYSVDSHIIPSLYLSGDMIDYGLIAERYVCFYLVDVSGHGAAPAFVTIWLKQLVRSYFQEEEVFLDPESHDADVARLLQAVNVEVINSGLGCHMTCFVGVIDTFTNKMQYAVGGHLPFPILVEKGGARYLTGKGKPIGIFEDAQWQTYSLDLPEEYSLVAFSDGVLEVLTASELIGKEDALLKILSRPHMSIDDICTEIGIRGNDSAPDDIAILKIDLEKS